MSPMVFTVSFGGFTRKNCCLVVVDLLFFFLVRKQSSIKTKKGQVLEYTGSIQRKENEEERRK